MNLHPLFAGFKGKDWSAVGEALGFVVQVATFRAAGTWRDKPNLSSLVDPRFAEVGFHFAGWWGAPGVHCLMYVRPRTPTALAMWVVGLGEWCEQVPKEFRASDFYSGADVLQDLEAAAFSEFGPGLAGWPCLTTDQIGSFVRMFAMLVNGFAEYTDNDPLAKKWKAGNVASAGNGA